MQFQQQQQQEQQEQEGRDQCWELVGSENWRKKGNVKEGTYIYIYIYIIVIRRVQGYTVFINPRALSCRVRGFINTVYPIGRDV